MTTADLFSPDPAGRDLLRVHSLAVTFHQGRFIPAVQDVGYRVEPDQAVALVGMSGSGKTVSTLSVFGLGGANPGVTGGQAWCRGENLLEGLGHAVQSRRTPAGRILRKDAAWEKLFRRRARQYLGATVGFIFQEPILALDPCYTIGEHLAEVYHRHDASISRSAARERAVEDLVRVNIRTAAAVADKFPHQLSGGMCQKVVILLALASNPALIIADEPTTALDSVSQVEVLDLLFRERARRKLGILFITHDVKLLQERFDRIAVLCRGYLVEWGERRHYFGSRPDLLHPYTRNLFGHRMAEGAGEAAEPDSAAGLDGGCPALAECSQATDLCRRLPGFVEVEPGHYVRCHQANPNIIVEHSGGRN
ncbi:MAG: ABC transporter ATP-binding protein [Candidatus Zixiibacteriota bacterium]|nr:MAG: ABC transporter ATP-binding protein [candidate division Zixibacteria bacterium]